MAVLFICDRCMDSIGRASTMVEVEGSMGYRLKTGKNEYHLCPKCMQDLRDFLAGDRGYTEQPEYAFD